MTRQNDIRMNYDLPRVLCIRNNVSGFCGWVCTSLSFLKNQLLCFTLDHLSPSTTWPSDRTDGSCGSTGWRNDCIFGEVFLRYGRVALDPVGPRHFFKPLPQFSVDDVPRSANHFMRRNAGLRLVGIGDEGHIKLGMKSLSQPQKR